MTYRGKLTIANGVEWFADLDYSDEGQLLITKYATDMAQTSILVTDSLREP